MGIRVIDGCHEAIWVRLDRFCGIYGASSADHWTSGSPALCFSLGEANRQNVKLAIMARKPPTGTQRHQNNAM